MVLMKAQRKLGNGNRVRDVAVGGVAVCVSVWPVDPLSDCSAPRSAAKQKNPKKCRMRNAKCVKVECSLCSIGPDPTCCAAKPS